MSSGSAPGNSDITTKMPHGASPVFVAFAEAIACIIPKSPQKHLAQLCTNPCINFPYNLGNGNYINGEMHSDYSYNMDSKLGLLSIC